MQAKPSLRQVDEGVVHADHSRLGEYTWYCEGASELLFTENESNTPASVGPAQRIGLCQGRVSRYVVSGEHGRSESLAAREPRPRRTTCWKSRLAAPGCAVAAERSSVIDKRHSRTSMTSSLSCWQTPTSSTIASAPTTLTEDERRVHRQALAGMLWSKQYYYFDLDRWLGEHDAHPLMGAGPSRASATPSGSTC